MLLWSPSKYGQCSHRLWGRISFKSVSRIFCLTFWTQEYRQNWHYITSAYHFYGMLPLLDLPRLPHIESDVLGFLLDFYHGERRRELSTFEQRLKRLKKDFQRNVGPSIKRHRYHLSKGERSRLKNQKALRRLNKRRRRGSYG
jgi:ribosomal protein S21